MAKVFKRRVSDLAINDMVDLTSCPYLRNHAMAGMVYGVVAHKEIEDPNTVVIGYEGIDHIGYPVDTVLHVKPAAIYLFPHELVESDHEGERNIRFFHKGSGVVINDPLMDPTGRVEVDPASEYRLTDADLKALQELNEAVVEAVNDAINAMAKSVQDHLLITTGDFAGRHFSCGRGHRKLKKVYTHCLSLRALSRFWNRPTSQKNKRMRSSIRVWRKPISRSVASGFRLPYSWKLPGMCTVPLGYRGWQRYET